MSKIAQHTKGPVYVGTQNDAVYVIVGYAPALNNDHPWHEAPRVAIAQVFDRSPDDRLVVDAVPNATLIAEAFNVATETGLTPRQLAEQRVELLEALAMSHGQMQMAAKCIEARRYDEALVHVSAMHGSRERVLTKATGQSV